MTGVDESKQSKKKRNRKPPIFTPGRVAWPTGLWCAESGQSHSQLYRWIASGRVKAVKSGRSTLVVTPPAEFVASLEPVKLSGGTADVPAP